MALKKNRCGRTPVSKISDNEDATASLGYSNELSVKDSVGDTIPELPKPTEEGVKIVSLPAALPLSSGSSCSFVA
jgi:hypothetical protein